MADLVISVEPIRRSCGAAATIDRFDLWRGGTHAVWIGAEGALHIESVAASLGDRPWVMVRMREALRTGKLVRNPEAGDDDAEEAEAVSDDAAD